MTAPLAIRPRGATVVRLGPLSARIDLRTIGITVVVVLVVGVFPNAFAELGDMASLVR